MSDPGSGRRRCPPRLVGPTGRVIAVEAHPQTFACLNETICLSGLDNVTAPCVAIADGEGSTTIVDTQNHLTSSIMVSGSGVEVLTRSLDSLADELEIGKIALLKMNIEGAERLAVRGMSHLSDRLENVVISCHDFLADRGNGEELRTKDNVRSSTLESYGYKIMTCPDHPLPWVRD